MEDKSYGCIGCAHFGGTRWVGDVQFVVCPRLPGGESEQIKTWRGCPERRGLDEKGPEQGSLF